VSSVNAGAEGEVAFDCGWDLDMERFSSMSAHELLDAYKSTGDKDYKWALVLRYKSMIKYVALQVRGVYSHFAQIDDVISEGVLTLSAVIDKYDPEKGVKFDTYIAKRIRGMVIDMARKHDWMPRNLRRMTREIDNAVSELYCELGRHPSDAEVAEKLGITEEKYQREAAGVAIGNMLSLDEILDAYGVENRRVELEARSDSEQPEAAFQARELQEVLAEGVSLLKKNEQIVLSLYYEKNLHMKEIAQVMEVSAPRVSQIHAGAIAKLQTFMREYMNGEATPRGRNRKKD